MFDFDTGKLLVIGIVALVVIGPKDLPRVLRQVGQMVAKIRRMAGEFQSQFMDAMREAELSDIRKDVEKAAEDAKIGLDFNPVADVKRELSSALSDRPAIPAGAPELDLDVPKFGQDMPDASGAGAAPTTEAGPVESQAANAGAESEPAPATVGPEHLSPITAEAIAPVAMPAAEHHPEPVEAPRASGPV